jgi:uncharacterized SAM-binding protein YcdF (DUF218 family)
MRRIKILLVLAALAGGAWLARHQLMQLAGNLLVRDDVGVPPAQYALLLMGDPSGIRADKALSLYRDHQTQKIAMAAPRRFGWVRRGIIDGDAEVHARYLKAQGVAPTDIVILRECDAVSTYDEAVCMRSFLKEQAGVERVVVVTSWYHSSRAGWLFRRLLGSLTVDVAAAAGPESRPEDYWRNRDDTIHVAVEYMKWAYWLVSFRNWEA